MSRRHTFRRRFDGWDSWRVTLNDFVLPALHVEMNSLQSLIDRWRPDLIVTTTFSIGPRIAAQLAGVKAATVSIYPQHELAMVGGKAFALRLRKAVATLSGLPVDSVAVTSLIWGDPGLTALLCDALLVPHTSAIALPALGYPYWDDLKTDEAVAADVRVWIESPGPPVILATAGSFLGMNRNRMLESIVQAPKTLDARVLAVGLNNRGQGSHNGERLMISPGFVPLSSVLPRVCAAVHHGGLGTSLACVHAQIPAVAVPQAFDQSHNARWLERHNAARCGDSEDLVGTLGPMLSELEDFRPSLAMLATRLTEPEIACAKAGAWIRSVLED